MRRSTAPLLTCPESSREWLLRDAPARRTAIENRLLETIAEEIKKDRATESLGHRFETWFPYAGAEPPALPRRAMFRVDMAGGGLTGAIFLARLSLSPTEEDWPEGAEERRSWLWDAVRPVRLFGKYGSNE